MSLIQDALKRQQEESESRRVPLKAAPARPPATLGVALRADNAGAVATAGRPVPSVPDAMPLPSCPESKVPPVMPSAPEPKAPPPTPGQPEKSGKSRLLIAGIIVFCVIIAWGGGLLVIPLAKQTLLGRFNLFQSRAPMVNPPVQAPLPPVLPPVVATPKPAAAPASAPAPLLSPAAAAAPAFAEEGEDGEDVALSSVNAQELPVTVPSAVPVVWPRLKLSAIFSNVGSGQAGARLNNRLILLGDQIEGVTLVEIHRDNVVLKCGKETRSLKMGMTLN